MNLFPNRFWRYLATVAAIAIVYFAIGRESVLIPSISRGITPLFPPAGISQGAFILGGYQIWPAIAIGDFLVALSTGQSAHIAAVMGLVATLQGLVGAALLRRVGFRASLERLEDVLALVILSAIASATIGPTINVSLMCLEKIVPWSNFGATWWTWWLGDAMGVLVVTPMILPWRKWPKTRPLPRQIIEAIVCLVLLVAVSWIVFGSKTNEAIAGYPLQYLPFPLIVWIVLRFGGRISTLATFLVCCIAIWGTATGGGPFLANANNPKEAILFLQAFMAVIALTALVIASTLQERAKALAQMRHIAALLREKEARLANAQRIAQLGNWDLDLQTHQLYWSDELYRILGLDPKAIAPSREIFLQAVHPDDREVVIQSFQKVIDEKKPYNVDYRLASPDNCDRLVCEQTEIFCDPAGHAIRITGTVQDITERKRTEQALQESNQELERSFKALQETQQQLIQSEKMSTLGQLVAGVAHEINNPVSFIYGNLTHLKQDVSNLLEILHLYQEEHTQPSPLLQNKIDSFELEFLKDDLPKIVSSLQMGTERIRSIVVSLRNFSRHDGEMKPVDIREGIESTLLILQNRLKANGKYPGIQVVKNYGELPPVECYAGELNQVFMNILANGIDALEERYANFIEQKQSKASAKVNLTSDEREFQPTIFISTYAVEDKIAVVKIADNASGMPEEVKAKIFNPFFTTKGIGKGTGLGLSISYKIVVEKHGGSLKCLSEIGQGTTFSIEIPLRFVKK